MTDSLIALREDLNTVGFEFPEQMTLQNLLQRQLEQFAVRANNVEPWRAGNRQSVRALVITGNSRVGKTDAVTQAFSNLEPVTTVDGRLIEPKTDLIFAPTIFTQAALAREVLRGLGYPATRKMTSDMAWPKVDERLAPSQFTHLAVDEAQYALAPSSVGRASFQNERIKIQGAFSRLLDHPIWPLPLVLIGLPVLREEYAHADFTFMRERSDFLEIDIMGIDSRREHGRLQRGIRALCELAEIGWDLHEGDQLFERLIHASSQARGIAIYLAKEAVIDAVRSGQQNLLIANFRDVYARKTGADAGDNPFASPEWANIDPKQLSTDGGILSQVRKFRNAR